MRKIITAGMVLGLLAGGPAEASAGAPLRMAGTAWFAGGGVPICASSTAPTCAGQPHVGGVSSNWWQCVELAQRFYQRRGWHKGIFAGVGIASHIFTKASALRMAPQPNGAITDIVPGDMIVMNRTGQAGHVVIVESITANRDGTRNVMTVGQNSKVVRNPMRWHGGVLDSFWASYSVAGVVRSPANIGILSYGGGAPTYEEVVNGGGIHPIGTALLSVTSTGQAFGGPLPHRAPTTMTGRIVDAAATRTGNGYWLASSTGQIFPYGDAKPYPTIKAGITAITTTDDGLLLTDAFGRVFAPGKKPTRSPEGYSGRFIDIEATKDGYWLLTSAGQIHGTAPWHGNATTFDAAIVAMSATPTGKGYVLLDKTGHVYAFGDAKHLGDLPTGSPEAADIAHTTNGYTIITKTGTTHSFGNSPTAPVTKGFAGYF
ncbi:hypothetical protein GCM10009555_073020 [Acrocarpospora macrocephala]|uniref:Peptidase C51 domain-containing protein n=1 Tax=Acrocarpospora macrocephala TaxID=150177 RepID=A0A5M3WMZ4_9ACTN|nr:CHAP domain-containing protein [Acrocarpospora macrocephala]GES08551.1 hypothetical protein Amac_021470 [Acrocarpospora macrocephala]